MPEVIIYLLMSESDDYAVISKTVDCSSINETTMHTFQKVAYKYRVIINKYVQ